MGAPQKFHAFECLNERHDRGASNARLRRMATCALLMFLLRSFTHGRRQVPVADILCCKPSELAFYPLPKLMIRRVGDHEAHSATRAVRLQAIDSPRLHLRAPPVAYAYGIALQCSTDCCSSSTHSHYLGRCWETYQQALCRIRYLVTSRQGGHRSKEEPWMTRNWHGVRFQQAWNLKFATPCDVCVGSDGGQSF